MMFFLISTSAFAQRADMDYGDIYYEFFQFREAAKHYEEALAKAKPKNKQYLYEQLSQCYKYLFEYEKAEQYFEKLIASESPIKPDYYIDYGNILKLNGKYKMAKDQFKKYEEVTGTDLAEPYMRSVVWAIRNADTLKNYAVFPTNLNISHQALGYCYYDDGLIYAHARNKAMGKSQTPLFDLDYAKKEPLSNTDFVKDMDLMALIEFTLNEGSPCVSADGQTLFFSANSTNLKTGKTKKIGGVEVSDDGVSNFKIYSAQLEGGLFQNPKELSFNDKEYSCIHPFITPDGKNLFFSSNMPGGFGGFDLFRSSLQDNGTWSEPVNMGKTVNTEENEIFPWASEDLFYFASKGFNNYGGYDIFVAQLNKALMPNTLKNIGQPINSFRDEVAFITKDGGRTGYFSSNRDNQEGSDYVYYFHETKHEDFVPEPMIDRDSMMAANGIIIPPPKPAAALPAAGTTTAGTGIAAAAGKDANSGTEPGVKGATDSKGTTGNKGTKGSKGSTPEAELNTLITQSFTPVLFSFNDAGTTPSQMQAADEVVQILDRTPELKVYIAAHTDSRGSFTYNMGLSERRAASVKRYLLSKGVPSAKIITKGLSESQLVNECADGVTCTEDQHSANRRVNMTLVK
jgi:outer membrane protein OmpA-like peptidoglycan-associated protein/tetratricopeptide (TPR) repeat protein